MEQDPFAPIYTAVRKDGTILLSAKAVAAMGLQDGDRVSVRVTAEELAERIKSLGVTEDEVDAISALQLESRDHVIRFLAAEGSLISQRSFRTKVRSWLR